MINKLIINLERRPERLQHHDLTDAEIIYAIDGRTLSPEEISSAKMRPNWRDPFRNRRMTKGEYGCFRSHMQCWEIVSRSDAPMLVLEDDALFTVEYDEAALLSRINDPALDFIYLGYNENIPENVIYHGDGFISPTFPYNTHAYLLTPQGARNLLNLTNEEDFSIIPLDDWFSEKISEKKLNVLATEVTMAKQLYRDVAGHDIDPSVSDWFDNYTVHVLTCATDEWKAFRLYKSAEHKNISITNIGKDVEWRGTDMSGPGGGQKINLLKQHLSTLPDTDIVIFVDGYDVFFTDTIEQIVNRWHTFGTRLLFASEKVCWPDTNLAPLFPEQPTQYKYLNSGTFIGEVGELKRFLQGEIEDYQDDQLFMQEKFLSGEFNAQLDSEQYIFQTYDESVRKQGHQIYNAETQCYGCLFHGNGGPEAKRKLDSLYEDFYTGLIPTNMYNIIHTDMLEIEFASEEWCNKLIKIAEEHGGWEPLPNDLFPAQEIRVKELGHGIYAELETHWANVVVPIVESYWHPIKMYGIRDAFVMKYTPETQNKLALHHDASLVTGSIKLNEAYEGGSLVYPRQNMSNDNTKIGDCILFPGQVTHGHQCEEITAGTKYSLTIWTSRYEGDIL
jgi:GR25 family glycosyltransferase involved in LPS biosynthesis